MLDTIKLHSSLHTECFETSWKKLVCLWAAVVFVHSERIVNFCKSQKKETKSLKLRKKCSNLEFFWSVFSSIRSEYGYLFCKSSYSVGCGKIRTRQISNFDTFHAMLASVKTENWSYLQYRLICSMLYFLTKALVLNIPYNDFPVKTSRNQII